jgi:pimeloyl-ACP methyl ester carboxylesterase
LLAGGTTMLSWPDALCERLAQGGRRVVRYDLRDSGASTTADPEAPAYTLRDSPPTRAPLTTRSRASCAAVVSESCPGARSSHPHAKAAKRSCDSSHRWQRPNERI